MTVSYLNFQSLIAVCFVVASFFVIRILHRAFFHSLRHYPGPRTWAISRLPWHYHNLRGNLAREINALHEMYGPIIRIGPDELSYASSRAWKQIYGQTKPEFQKCLDGRGIAPVMKQAHLRGIIAADDDKHRRLRRAIVPAFSERALKEQEQCLQRHSSKLIDRLQERCTGQPIDVVKWFSLATFDIISELTFGEADGCLDAPDEPWLAVLGARAKTIRWYQFSIYYGFHDLFARGAPKSMTKSREEHMKLLASKVQRRLKRTDHQKDFMSYIVDNKADVLSSSELVIMASAFIVAGSGTSARALAATVYYLALYPDKLARAAGEVREVFESLEQITIKSTSSLEYMTACINEAMRMHPPNPSTIPRFVPKEGAMIEGELVPGGIAVGVHQLSSGLASWNFARAKEYLPERWLDVSDDSEFARDDKASAQPFSYGPRGCVGVNLAYAEMRIVLAKMLYSFDLEMTPEARGWTERQKSYLTWEQIPLMVKLNIRL